MPSGLSSFQVPIAMCSPFSVVVKHVVIKEESNILEGKAINTRLFSTACQRKTGSSSLEKTLL